VSVKNLSKTEIRMLIFGADHKVIPKNEMERKALVRRASLYLREKNRLAYKELVQDE